MSKQKKSKNTQVFSVGDIIRFKHGEAQVLCVYSNGTIRVKEANGICSTVYSWECEKNEERDY